MNNNYKKRDEIIFGNYNANRYSCGGCARADVSYVQMKKLVDEDYISLDENQNDSPTTEDFMNAIQGYENNVTFEIYAIEPEREDYRVTIDGISIHFSDKDKDALSFFVEQWRYADEFNIYEQNGEYYIRAWWD